MNDISKTEKAGIVGALLGMVAGGTLVFLANAKNRERIVKGFRQADVDAHKQLAAMKVSIDNASVQSKKTLAKNLRAYAKQLETGKQK